MKKKTGKLRILLIAGAIAALMIAIAVIAALKGDNKPFEETAEAEKSEELTDEIQDHAPEGAKKSGLTFPYQLESGKIEISSVFPFTGLNPDCSWEEGENIASLSITNKSQEHLVSANLSVALDDGAELHFAVTDIPAGQSVMVFSAENAVYEASNECKAIACEAEFEESASLLMEESLSVSVNGTEVTLTNLSDEDLTDLVIHCHTLFDGEYFGGLTYSYPVDNVAAGESIILHADDCYLGEAAVVRISQDN